MSKKFTNAFALETEESFIAATITYDESGDIISTDATLLCRK